MFGAYQNNANSLKIINKIAPHWNTVVVKSSMNSKSDVLRNIRNDINIPVDKGMDIFLGKYEDIDNVNVGVSCSQLQKNEAKKALLLYPDKFNQLNTTQQDNILTFLSKYRSTFNKLCIDAAQTIFRSIEKSEQNYNYDRLNKEITHAFNNSSIIENINGSFVSLFNSYNRSIKNNANMLMTDKISWCCSFYFPLVKKLSENIKQDKQTETIYKQFYSKNNLMNIFPIVNEKSKTNIPQMSLTTKQTQQTQPFIGGNVNKTKYVYVGGDDRQTTSKSSTSEYIEELIAGQIEFNKSFEQIYKDLTKSLYSITITDKQTTQSTSLNGCLYAIKSIEINSPKTSYKISGYYAAKNWNKYYINTCYKVVETLRKDGMGLFDETIKCVQDLINLCESSAKKADDLISKYITSVKISSETFANVKNVSKIACKLSYQELNRYGENIKRLEQAFTSISNQTSIYSTTQLLDNFLTHVQDRADLIRDYFRNKETQLKLNGSSGFNNDRVEMLLQFNNQVKQCMLYLNQTVDTKLAEYRKQKTATKVDDKLFAKFEKAMIMFKDLSNNANLRNILEKLHIVLHGVDFEGNIQLDKQKKYGLDLIKIVQRFWKESGYVDFIIQLYTELNIFSDGFNWSEFRDNITLLLSIINITVSTTYKVKTEALDNAGNVVGKIRAEQELEVSVKDSTSIQNVVNQIVNGIVNDYGIVDNNGINILQTAVFNTIQQMFNFASSSDKLVGQTQQINIMVGAGFVQHVFTITLYDKRFAMTLTSKNENDNGELRLTKMVFDAMLVNVLDVINNYTSVKYTGNFKLPIQLSNIIKGGNAENLLTFEDKDGKTYGGNVFDILSVNDNNYDGVIVDATPFYVCAFNILIFYYSKYNVQKVGDNVSTPTLFFYVPKISPLYPIYKKIEAYNIDGTNKLNVNLIKTGVGVFNNYWRKAVGSTSGEKLSNAIDILLNEVNACMVYSSKLQFDSLQITGKLSNNFLQNLSSNIQNLSHSLIDAINEAVVSMSMDTLQQTELFETLMKNNLNKVRSKANSEEEKLTMLIDILTKTDEQKDASNEIYKFVDFGVMPMLETLVAYNNVFKVYDLYLTDNKATDAQEIDLTRIQFTRRSIFENKNGTQITYSAWLEDILASPNADVEMTLLREQLETSTVVNAWNTIVLANYIDECMTTKNYKQPSLWYPNIYDSWPRDGHFVVRRESNSVGVQQNTADIMLTLYQLYPYINGKTIWDYFESTLSEFTSDIDHCLHLLMSFPNINDKFIKAINNEVHKIVDDDQEITARLGISDEVKTRLQSINMKHDLGFIKPPAYKSNYFIPQFTHDKSILQQMVVYNAGEYVPSYVDSKQKFIRVDGYNQSILVQRFSNISDNVAEYSWTDWVIQKLAECDSSFGCIPYKFVEALRAQSAIAYRCQPIIFDSSSTSSQPLAETPKGKYTNPITGNIIARSISEKNISKTDDNGKISQQWIANLIGIIPYMINKIKTYYNNVGANVDYENVNVKTELNILLTILSTFYNDIVSFCPKVGFMENLTLFDNNRQYHAIAEIIPHLQKFNFENSTSSLFSKYIWANRHFFGTNTDILFPESKDYDRFEKLKQFGGNVFNNAVFANEFNSVLSILGKCLIMSSIATSSKENHENNNMSNYMFKTLAKAIYYSSELIPQVHTRLINNVLSSLVNDNDLIDTYNKTIEPSKRPERNLQSSDVSTMISDLIKTIVANDWNIAIGRIGQGQDESLIIDKFVHGRLTQNDVVEHSNVVNNLYNIIRFQTDDNGIDLPKEASMRFISNLIKAPTIFWVWVNKVCAQANQHLNDLVKPIDRVGTVNDDWHHVSNGTVYVLAIAIIIHFVNNICVITNNLDETRVKPLLDEICDISSNVLPFGVNPTGRVKDGKFLHNLAVNIAPGAMNANAFSAITEVFKFRSPSLIKYFTRVIAALTIMSQNSVNILSTFINAFSIGSNTAGVLNKLHSMFKSIHPIDLFFNINSINLSADGTLTQAFERNLDDGDIIETDDSIIQRDGVSRLIRYKLTGFGVNIDVDSNSCIKIINSEGFADDAANDKDTFVGVRYDAAHMSVLDDAHTIGAPIDYTTRTPLINIDKTEFQNILIHPPNDTYNLLPIWMFNKSSFPNTMNFLGGKFTNNKFVNGKFTNNKFVGGVSPNRLYGMLFSGIADVNRLNNLPFDIYKETTLDEAIKNVCFVLNTIPEYKICGVYNGSTYVPQSSLYYGANLNMLSYIRHRTPDNMTTSVNNFVYDKLYVFPPNHGQITNEGYRITNNELQSIINTNVFTVQPYLELRAAILDISRLLRVVDGNGAGRRRIEIINPNIDNVVHVINSLLRIYKHVGTNKVDDKEYRIFNVISYMGEPYAGVDGDGSKYYFDDRLYMLMCGQNYHVLNVANTSAGILSPVNFGDIFVYFIEQIENVNARMADQFKVTIALYLTFLSQSIKDDTLSSILNYSNNPNTVIDIMDKLLSVIYLKSMFCDAYSIFKSIYQTGPCFSQNVQLVQKELVNDVLKVDRDYERFVGYQVNRSALLITTINQPRIVLFNNNIQYSNIDSYTAAYHLINPVAGLLNASGSLINCLENTNVVDIIGCPYTYINKNFDNTVDNIYDNAIGMINTINNNIPRHTVNKNKTYETFSSVRQKYFMQNIDNINDFIDNNADTTFNYADDFDNQPLGTHDNPNILGLIQFVNKYASTKMFKFLLQVVKNRKDAAADEPTFLNETIHDGYTMFYQAQLFRGDITDAVINNVRTNSDSQGNSYGPNYPLITMLKNENPVYESHPYFNSDANKLNGDTTIIRLFDSCKNILNKINTVLTTTISQTFNTGFAHGLFTGGVLTSVDDLVNKFVDNVDFIGSYYSPTETYKAIYKIGPSDDKLTKSLYSHLFKYTPIEPLKTEFMFALIINYFHKYTVSFNSIYSSVIFPSIIYGNAVFNTIANKYKETLLNARINGDNDFTSFVHKYLTSIDMNTFDKYYSEQDDKVNRDTKRQTYKQLADRVIGHDDMYKVSTMVSVNDKLLNTLNKHNFIGEHGNDTFMNSSLLGTLKRIDAVETFTFVILLITKYMSYYNIDTDEDVSYSGQIGPNPLGYNIAV